LVSEPLVSKKLVKSIISTPKIMSRKYCHDSVIAEKYDEEIFQV
jgi:hypothetical protein